MFSEELEKINWEETSQAIYAKTEADVLRALGKERCTVDDFMALISPAAEKYLEPMAQLAVNIPRNASAKPCRCLFLSISPIHAPTHVYIAASMSVTLWHVPFLLRRKSRTNIKPSRSWDLLKTCFSLRARTRLRQVYLIWHVHSTWPNLYFSNLKIEVMPLKVEEYAELVKHGLNGVICFQETYNKARYNIYHPRGMKSKFEWRVNGFDRMGQAGVHSIGMGVLIGLEDWRTDVTMMAHHLRYLQKRYWKTKYSVNFPRMRPAENEGFQPNVIMSDKELAQVTFAMRIFDHDVDISYSTREPAYIRDHMASLGVTTMSAESKTEPGGYYTYPQALEQFHISDDRTAVEVEKALKQLGREPVSKDWDASFDLCKI